MANIKSAKKRILVNSTKAERNKANRSAVKTSIKKVETAVENKDKACLLYTSEATERFQEENVEVHGVEIREKYDEEKDVRTTVVRITTENGARTMGKPQGTYTVSYTHLQRDTNNCSY